MKNNNINQLSDGKKNSYLHSYSTFRLKNLLKNKSTGLFNLICLMALIIFSQTISAQTTGVKVSVVDANGKPFEGVRIESVSNPSGLVMTDSLGMATLDMNATGLIKLYHDDKQKTVAVNSEMLNVQLSKSDKNIDLGYGISKPVDQITSAVDIVYSDKLEKSSLWNPEESLYGKLTGLMVLQNGGNPWSRSPTMFIRGVGTLNNNSILVLVDGFERDIESLSLSDIESIAVLKDGTALARYGQRGANGVILVTTKRGAYDTFKVEWSYDQGWNFPFRTPEFVDGYTYARAVNQASVLDGNSEIYSNLDLLGFQNGESQYYLPNVNWFDEAFKDFGTTTNFSANFTGGGKTLKYFASLNYQNERGLFDNTDIDVRYDSQLKDERYDSQLKYDRLTFRTNLDIDLTNTTKFLVNVSGNIDGNQEPKAQVSSIMNALYSVPSAAFPVVTPDGLWGGTSFYDNNPMALIASTGVRNPNGRQIKADGKIIQDLGKWVEGLSAEVAVAYDNELTMSETRSREFLYQRLLFFRSTATGEIIEAPSSIFGTDTDLDFSSSFRDQIRHATFYGKVNYDTTWDNSALNTSVMYHKDKRVKNGQYNTYLHQKMLASTSYAYKNRYFVDGVVSYSGSSVLPKDNRYGIFPAISAGWVINRENFLKDSKTIDYLKLRASWGMSGNDIMSFNLWDQAFNSGGTYYFNDNNNSDGGIYEGRLASENLTYENSTKMNLGVDMELLRKLSMSVDAFYDKREDIILATNGDVPSLIGVNTAYENVGIVENRGVEASLLWKEEVGEFKYFVGGNFTFAKNEIVEMNEEFLPYDYLYSTGNSVDQQFGLQALGFFENQADIDAHPQQLFSDVRPGDIKYKDQNNDGVIDGLDVIPMGNAGAYPEMYFSLNFGYEMKGLGIDLLFQGIANQTIYLNTKSVYVPLRNNTTLTNLSANSWTPETAQTATLPRLSLLENENNYQRNDIWLAQGDYFKFRHFEIYYKFPERLISKLKMKKAKLYARGMNTFSIDHINTLDPESIGVGYPTLASYHVGINLEF